MSNIQMTVSQQRDIANSLSTAFPRVLHTDVQAVLGILPIGQHDPTHYDIGPIRINSKYLHIPCRIYSDEPPLISIDNLNSTQRLILSCLLTRHHNGFFRERYASEIRSSPEDWITPT